jgi:xylulokinase
VRHILVHDLGTSSNKATLFSEDGRLVCSAVAPYPTRYFNGNWAEQDPSDWWEAICSSSRSLLEQSSIKPGEIAVVCFSGHMMGCLCVDRNGVPLRPHILWADQRAQEQASRIQESIAPERFYRITGHRNSASYGLQKLLWIRDHQPEIYEATAWMLNAKDWLVFRFTGRIMTEYSDASGTNAFDLNRMDWSEEILTTAGIDAGMFPPLVPSTHVAGYVTNEAASQTGLPPGTPVVVGGGDGLCATVGAGCIEEGIAHGCIGTSAWISFAASKPLFDPQMRTFNWAHLVPGMICPCGTMQTAGSAYAWLKREICTSEMERAERNRCDPHELISQEISESPQGSRGVVFLPYLIGERSPHWNPKARGAFIGIGLETRRSDVLRSVLEGITMNLGLIVEIFRDSGFPLPSIRMIGGGAKDSEWCRMMSDIWQTQIVRHNDLEEATSRGAAVTAGVGIGLYRDFHAIDRFLHTSEVLSPDSAALETYRHPKMIFEQSYRALLPIFQNMAQL